MAQLDNVAVTIGKAAYDLVVLVIIYSIAATFATGFKDSGAHKSITES